MIFFPSGLFAGGEPWLAAAIAARFASFLPGRRLLVRIAVGALVGRAIPVAAPGVEGRPVALLGPLRRALAPALLGAGRALAGDVATLGVPGDVPDPARNQPERDDQAHTRGCAATADTTRRGPLHGGTRKRRRWSLASVHY